MSLYRDASWYGEARKIASKIVKAYSQWEVAELFKKMPTPATIMRLEEANTVTDILLCLKAIEYLKIQYLIKLRGKVQVEDFWKIVNGISAYEQQRVNV